MADMMPTVARNTLLSALEERRRQQMKKFLLHRLIFVAMLQEDASESQITAFPEDFTIPFGEAASGVLLIYSQSILHILEASSGTLYHILMDLALFEHQGAAALLRDIKIMVMSHNIPTRLFSQWNATKLEVPVTLEDVTQSQTTEEVITECLTLILKMGVYLATLKMGNKDLGECLRTAVPGAADPSRNDPVFVQEPRMFEPGRISEDVQEAFAATNGFRNSMAYSYSYVYMKSYKEATYQCV